MLCHILIAVSDDTMTNRRLRDQMIREGKLLGGYFPKADIAYTLIEGNMQNIMASLPKEVAQSSLPPLDLE
jgi:hypothetical protein